MIKGMEFGRTHLDGSFFPGGMPVNKNIPYMLKEIMFFKEVFYWKNGFIV